MFAFTANNRNNKCFSEKVFKFSLLTANNAIYFFTLSFLVIENILVLFYHSFHIR